MVRIASLFFLIVSTMLAQAITVTASSKGQNVSLVAHPSASTTLPAHAGYKTEFLKDEAKEEVANRVGSTALAGVATHVPIAGTAAVIGFGKAKGLLYKKQTKTESYNLSFVQGLTASVTVSGSELVLVVSAETMRTYGVNSTPILLKVSPSAKDQARIIRAAHVLTELTKSAINPMQTQVLGIEQKEISSKLEKRDNGDLSLTPTSLLENGEYVVALADSVTKELQGLVWDFRVQ